MGRKPVQSKRIIGYSDPSNVEQGGGLQTINSDFTTDDIHVSQTDKMSLHLVWENSTLDADVYVQARNGDAEEDEWRNLDFGASIEITGASGQHEINLFELPFTWLRIFIDRNSGAGDVGCAFVAKAVGA